MRTRFTEVATIAMVAAAIWSAPSSAQPRRPQFDLGAGPWTYSTFEQGMRIRVSVVTRGLSHPWGMVFLPGTAAVENPMGDALITERDNGQVRLLKGGRLEPEPVAKIGELFPVSELFDIALHPNFEQNGFVYFSYIKKGARPDGTDGYYVTNALLRGRFDGKRIENIEEIFEAKSWSTNFGGASSTVMFQPDGTLLLSSSHRLHLDRPQRLDTHIGKILRLNDDGSVPGDNPFVGVEGALPEIYSYGHRSVMRFAIHPTTGETWEIENGPLGGDEVNILKPGLNYGWPVVSFGYDYDGSEVTPGTRPWGEGMEQPKLAWVPSITVSSLAFYTGDKLPAWKNNLFATSMVTGRLPGTGHLQRVVLNENGELRREQLLNDLRQRIRYVRQGPDELLYLLTDENDGVVLRIEPDAETTSAAAAPAGGAAAPGPGASGAPSGAVPAVTSAAAASSASAASVATAAASPAVADAASPDGDASLFGLNDCGLCHQTDQRNVGPSFREVANRYTADDATIDKLARNIIDGSAGSWGDVPMTSHSGIGIEEAREIVKRILALRTR